MVAPERPGGSAPDDLLKNRFLHTYILGPALHRHWRPPAPVWQHNSIQSAGRTTWQRKSCRRRGSPTVVRPAISPSLLAAHPWAHAKERLPIVAHRFSLRRLFVSFRILWGFLFFRTRWVLLERRGLGLGSSAVTSRLPCLATIRKGLALALAIARLLLGSFSLSRTVFSSWRKVSYLFFAS